MTPFVHVFTKDGVLLRSIGHDKEELKKPRGLCVRGQYVYVTDINSHCVFVFTTDGEYVTSFGQGGQKEGDFNTPSYIMLITMVSFVLLIFITIACRVFSVLLYNCNHIIH